MVHSVVSFYFTINFFYQNDIHSDAYFTPNAVFVNMGMESSGILEVHCSVFPG